MAATRYYLAQSLDGYLAEADGGIDWLEDYEGEAELAGADLLDGSYEEFIAGIGALAMGSATYEFVLGVGSWPYEGLPTWVFTSRELPAMEGADIRFASGDVAPHHAELTAARGRPRHLARGRRPPRAPQFAGGRPARRADPDGRARGARLGPADLRGAPARSG